MIGIYQIKNKDNGKVYVGSSVNVGNRLSGHKKMLVENRHANKRLQGAWNKYGENSFEFSPIICFKDSKKLLIAEQYWIDKLDSANKGYNICPVAGNTLGRKFSKATCKKISAFRKGKKLSEATCKKMSESLKGNKHLLGHKHSEETKGKISKGNKGKKRTEESKERYSNARKKENLSEETRKKMSDNMKGNFRWLGKKHSEETKGKISKAMIGRILSDEWKQKISEAIKRRKKEDHPFFNKHLSEEHKRKISEGLKRNINAKGKKWSEEGRTCDILSRG